MRIQCLRKAIDPRYEDAINFVAILLPAGRNELFVEAMSLAQKVMIREDTEA
jgi:hypothetical protein